YLTCNLR
nr:RecName: Full=Uncharacterized protein IMPP3 [Nautilus macromphalus]